MDDALLPDIPLRPPHRDLHRSKAAPGDGPPLQRLQTKGNCWCVWRRMALQSRDHHEKVFASRHARRFRLTGQRLQFSLDRPDLAVCLVPGPQDVAVPDRHGATVRVLPLRRFEHF